GDLDVSFGARPQAELLLGETDLRHHARRLADGGRALEGLERVLRLPLPAKLHATAQKVLEIVGCRSRPPSREDACGQHARGRHDHQPHRCRLPLLTTSHDLQARTSPFPPLLPKRPCFRNAPVQQNPRNAPAPSLNGRELIVILAFLPSWLRKPSCATW